MIISRYLIIEVLDTLLAVTAVLLLILLSNSLVRYLTYAAHGKVASNILLQLLGFETPYLLSLLLPLGLYIGIILAYGRLCADHEMSVLRACGLGMQRLIGITSLLAISITIIVAVLMLWINPLLAAKREQVIAQDNVINLLQPGRFHTSSGGRVIYIEQISRDHKQANNVFIADRGKKAKESSPWRVLSAEQAYQKNDPVTQDRFIVTADGYRYDGVPGQNDFTVIKFNEYAVRIAAADMDNKRRDLQAISTRTLWENHGKAKSAAELQWRFSIPLSAFLLALLAVPLSYVRPRQGRFATLFPAILLYIIYINLLFVARNWLEQGAVPAGLGMWWVHIFMVMIIIVVILFQSNNGSRLVSSKKPSL